MKSAILSIVLTCIFGSAFAKKGDYSKEITLSCAVKEKGGESEKYLNKNIQVTVFVIENGDGKYYLNLMFDGSDMMTTGNVIEKEDLNKFEVFQRRSDKFKDKNTNKIFTITYTSSVTINRNNGFISYDFVSNHSDGIIMTVKGSGTCNKVEANSKKF